jgi:CO/xanthine dehydrogenase Mo-binding subunit
VTTYYSGQLLTAPYAMPAYRFDSTRVFTNKPCCGPKRGHGSVQPRFAFECQLDKLAEAAASIRSSCAGATRWAEEPAHGERHGA